MATFYIEQFGCRATQADGAALERQLRERGFTPVSEPTAADVVVVNTCTVTAAADTQAREAIRKICRQNRAARVIVTGCYAQRAPEELAALPGVTWVVGNSHKPQIPQLIEALPPIAPRRSSDFNANSFVLVSALEIAPRSPLQVPAQTLIGNIFQQNSFLAAPVLGGEANHTRPTLKIQDGCNSRCSYCVIPFVRGKSRSLPPDSVVKEIQSLSDSGYREIVLSGINLGTYGRDLSPRVRFEDLLRRILDETEIPRLRLSSIEPLDVTRNLIDLFGADNRLAHHFHMPLQSGSDRMLAAMNRWYRAEHYARRVDLIRERLPHASIGADVIIGFPGETEDDHAATLLFIERLDFTYLHVFSFSKRPGTKAAAHSNQVPANVIKRRARELRSLGERKAADFRNSQVGRILHVVTLRSDSEGLVVDCAQPPSTVYTPALSSNYLRIRISGAWPANMLLRVHIQAMEGNYLKGEVQ